MKINAICIISNPDNAKKNIYRVLNFDGTEKAALQYAHKLFTNPKIYFYCEIGQGYTVIEKIEERLQSKCLNPKEEDWDLKNYRIKLTDMIGICEDCIEDFDRSPSESESEDESCENEDESDDGECEHSICDDCIQEYLERKGLMPKSQDNSTNISDSNNHHQHLSQPISQPNARIIELGQNIVKAPQFINTGSNNHFVINQYFVTPAEEKPKSGKRSNSKAKLVPVGAGPVPAGPVSAAVTLDLKKEIAFDLLNKLTVDEINEKQYNFLMNIIDNTSNIELMSIITKVLIKSFCTGTEIDNNTIQNEIKKEEAMTEYIKNNCC